MLLDAAAVKHETGSSKIQQLPAKVKSKDPKIKAHYCIDVSNKFQKRPTKQSQDFRQYDEG